MNEVMFEERLLNLIAEDEDWMLAKSVNTFENEGILTHNKGLVVRLNNGSEFQITIVKSR